MISIGTKSVKETQQVARFLAEEVRPCRNRAMVIALIGELGAGKTTFVQGFARSLGVRDKVLSPTFVLMKIYPLKLRRTKFRHLVHIDCYRLDAVADMTHLGFRDILKDQDAIVLIEWADRIKKLIPCGTLWIQFQHEVRANTRILQISI